MKFSEIAGAIPMGLVWRLPSDNEEWVRVDKATGVAVGEAGGRVLTVHRGSYPTPRGSMPCGSYAIWDGGRAVNNGGYAEEVFGTYHAIERVGEYRWENNVKKGGGVEFYIPA